jgi:hypothetical protein
MIRQLVRGVVVLAAIALLLDSAVGRQQGNADKIVVREKNGSTKNYEGTLKFVETGYQILNSESKATATIAPIDIVKVIPGDLVGADRPSLLSQLSLEEKKTRKDNETARLGYIEMIQKAGGAPPKTKQFLAFKKAWLSTKILDESDDDEWAKQIDGVVKEWGDYQSDYKTGWEQWYAARTYARLNAELGKFRDIETMWKRTSAKEVELPVDLRLEANIQLIDAQIRGGGTGFAAAATAAEALMKSAPGVIAKDKLAIYARAGLVGETPSAEVLNAAVKDINDKIAASKEPIVRAVGFSMLGELYLAAKKPRDAMWAFLWVETVYNQDKDEVLKAMVRLKQCFKEQMDEDREKTYQDKIRRYRLQF